MWHVYQIKCMDTMRLDPLPKLKIHGLRVRSSVTGDRAVSVIEWTWNNSKKLKLNDNQYDTFS